MATITKRLLLSDLVSTDKIDQVPSNYIRPITQRPNLQSVVRDSIPLIDLHNLFGPNRGQVIDQIGRACRDYGFFQVKNHSVPELTISNMMQTARDFFNLPEQERLKNYSDDPQKTTRLSTSFNIRTEKVANWRDYLRLHCYPIENFVHEWPTNPTSFRAHVAEYCTSVRGLAVQLIEAISESLGLEKEYIGRQLGKHAQHMALNYYPPCPQPDLTYGLPGHTDLNLITILLQDQVPGLQVLRNGHWVAVDPVPNTFIINIGDQIQVMSNDKYKSVLHRAVVNCDKERISIPTFYCPSPEAVIGPAPELVTDDEPAVYRQFTYGEYYEKFWNRGLATESCLDMFMAT
ncbi:putative flavanone 3-dioxygenase [Helianthus annuus]|uniref:Flavanone 3-dioxygenase n=1 Tax=Helianthus annuus TaxID=4232 RepID=A0A251VAT3_HELAN|nr:protein DMR6-LIKE OXYGENASE 2 [Helianthus annuus]KAF5815859.1 putative flavanone 3-dioxygenase [Helianthus annuus]KAJ0594259.1 putative flavanone 3-dioxygenase [Helianthus annuus]KAJ0602397.1 putative flavanone 3-dioxygenase [Helianthus annuus]KAJ0609279.1 putative flavanone 3-dioxygenase [Helianthus annuus]KAJ0769337.1 putative flavanone 3-dioxygenase [Helianthus annuus]